MRKRSSNASSRLHQLVESDDVEDDGDLLMDAMDSVHDNSHVTQRVHLSSALDTLDEEGMSDDDDGMSVMSDITSNSNVHSRVDSSNAWIGGFDVQAGEACVERMQIVTISEKNSQ